MNIYYETIAKATPENPRNDTANILERQDGSWMVVWHRFYHSKDGGSDFGICKIHSKYSQDEGKTWTDDRMLIDVPKGDVNVQAPALCRLHNGTILLSYLRVHAHNSTSMWVCRSDDDGKTFHTHTPIWEHSQGQLLQGGTSSLVLLKNGRLILPFHGGTGDQWSQKNSAGCYISDDNGFTWQRSYNLVELPMRGAMEASIAENTDETLVMSLRTQLGSVFLSKSVDKGEHWSLAQSTGLHAPEACTCIRTVPQTGQLLLIFNNSLYDPSHHHYGKRSPLTVAVSDNCGKSWRIVCNIEKGPMEFTNINATVTSKGKIAVTYMRADDPNPQAFPCENMDLCLAVLDIKDLEKDPTQSD